MPYRAGSMAVTLALTFLAVSSVQENLALDSDSFLPGVSHKFDSVINYISKKLNPLNVNGDRLDVSQTDGASRDGLNYYHGNSSHLIEITPETTDSESNIDNDVKVSCRHVHNLNVSQYCHFVTTTSSCLVYALINYIHWTYCTLTHLIPLAVIVLMLWWFFLIIALATAADDFFCPNLVVISKLLHFSDNIAGVTLMAFGNGAPDIFSAISAMNSHHAPNPSLAFAALFGAGIFVSSVVVGTIAFVRPFIVMNRPFLRDTIFYIAATFWAFYVIWDGKVRKFESLGFIVLYVAYVVVVIVGRFIRVNTELRTLHVQEIEPPPPVSDCEKQAASDKEIQKSSESRSEGPELKKELSKAGVCDSHDNVLHHVSNYSSQDHLVCPSENVENSGKCSSLKDFFLSISPLSLSKIREQRWYISIFDIIKAPIIVCLNLTIPLVDYKNDLNNWNRYLNSLHCITSPLFVLFSVKHGTDLIGGVFPLYGLVLIIGFLLSVIVFVTSKNSEPPRYFPAFAFIGFVVSVIWVKLIADEVVSLLETFGVIFNIPSAVLGLTLLAWANSLGDFINNTVVARMGYPRAGISACFGGPLFNLLVGIGISFSIRIFKNGKDIILQTKGSDLILVWFLLGSLVSSFIIVPLSKFRMTRFYGVYLWLYYVIFLIVALLASFHIIDVHRYWSH